MEGVQIEVTMGLDSDLCLQGHTKWVGDFSTLVGVYKDGNKEAEGIEEVSAKHSKTRKLQQLQFMNIEKTFQGFNVSNVTSMDTLREIVLPGRKEENMPPLLMLIQNHLREMKA